MWLRLIPTEKTDPELAPFRAGLVFGFFNAMTWQIGIGTPMVLFAEVLGATPLQVGLSVGVGTSNVFMPYQGAPFMMAYAYGYVTMRQFVAAMMLISLVNLVVLIPLNLVYWNWVGLF